MSEGRAQWRKVCLDRSPGSHVSDSVSNRWNSPETARLGKSLFPLRPTRDEEWLASCFKGWTLGSTVSCSLQDPKCPAHPSDIQFSLSLTNAWGGVKMLTNYRQALCVYNRDYPATSTQHVYSVLCDRQDVMGNSFGVNTDCVKDGFPSHTSLNLHVNAEMGASYRRDC